MRNLKLRACPVAPDILGKLLDLVDDGSLSGKCICFPPFALKD